MRNFAASANGWSRIAKTCADEPRNGNGTVRVRVKYRRLSLGDLSPRPRFDRAFPTRLAGGLSEAAPQTPRLADSHSMRGSARDRAGVVAGERRSQSTRKQTTNAARS